MSILFCQTGFDVQINAKRTKFKFSDHVKIPKWDHSIITFALKA